MFVILEVCADSIAFFSLFNSACCAATGSDLINSIFLPKASLIWVVLKLVRKLVVKKLNNEIPQ